ncbi:MAG: hypothetical protein IPF68_08460 [Bacteroidales bacterium]|nr:hypothetical protein [Bacteroidales bacterium]
MKKLIFPILLIFFLFSGKHGFTQEAEVVPIQESPVSFVISLNPTSLIISPDKTGFTIHSANEMDEDDVVTGFSFNTPNMKAGLGFNSRLVQVDLLAGCGSLISGRISGNFFSGDAYCRFRPTPVISVGVHAGFMRYTPKWDFFGLSWSNPDDVSFSAVNGLLIGPVFSFGKRACFTISLDYATGVTDVRTHNGYSANRDKLDLGGLMLNYGLLMRVP